MPRRPSRRSKLVSQYGHNCEDDIEIKLLKYLKPEQKQTIQSFECLDLYKYNACRRHLRDKFRLKKSKEHVQEQHRACIASLAANSQYCELLKPKDCMVDGRCVYNAPKCHSKYCEDRDELNCHYMDGCRWNQNGCGQLRGQDPFFESHENHIQMEHPNPFLDRVAVTQSDDEYYSADE